MSSQGTPRQDAAHRPQEWGDDLLDGLLEATALKALPRAGWVRQGVRGPESVAGHSWGVAWLVLALLPDTMDRGRALAYAVLHDLPEVRVGDLTPKDQVSPAHKHQREAAAMEGLAARVGETRGGALSELWQAYEAQGDPEARFVRELDRLDMALQALTYARQGAQGMAEFLESAAEVVRDPALAPLLSEVRARLDVIRG